MFSKAGFAAVFGVSFLIIGTCCFAEDIPKPPAGMVYLPGGEFRMGLEGASNKTPHQVFLNPLLIDINEVTQADYEHLFGKNPSGFKGADRPVDRVTWFEAWAYCKQVGKRLPTEAEWEYAARGGTNSLYFWGEEFDPEMTWNQMNSGAETHPVKQKPANPFGLHDTQGNVWEWVSDWYGKYYYEESPRENPQGPVAGEEKVIRGGSWYSEGKHQTSATRYWAEPSTRNSNFGFRCVKDIT